MVSEYDLSRLSTVVAQKTGLYFPQTRYADLRHTLKVMAQENGFDSADSCLGWLLSDANDLQRFNLLVKYLTVGETYFLRDQVVFDLLKNKILPERMRAHQDSGEQRLKIWSAACSSGEEPYSIAITLDQMPKGNDRQIDLRATDINHGHLERARAGLYSQWSFRTSPSWLKTAYFSARGDMFQISQRVIDMVSFSTLNLSGLDYPPPFDKEASLDVIFCRNVLMYFSASLQQQIITTLSRLLAPAGWLIVSPCETGIVRDVSLRGERIADCLFFRKIEARSRMQAAPLTNYIGRIHAGTKLPQTAGAASFGKAGSPGLSGQEDWQSATASASQPAPRQLSGQELYLQAQAHYQMRRFALAESELKSLLNSDLGVERNPALTGQILSLLARINADQGRLEMAGQLYQEAVLADKLNPDHYFNLAMICQELGDAEGTIKNMRKVIYLDPDFVMAHFHLGMLVKERAAQRRHLTLAYDLLGKVEPDAHLPFADEMSAGRIQEMVKAMLEN